MEIITDSIDVSRDSDACIGEARLLGTKQSAARLTSPTRKRGSQVRHSLIRQAMAESLTLTLEVVLQVGSAAIAKLGVATVACDGTAGAGNQIYRVAGAGDSLR